MNSVGYVFNVPISKDFEHVENVLHAPHSSPLGNELVHCERQSLPLSRVASTTREIASLRTTVKVCSSSRPLTSENADGRSRVRREVVSAFHDDGRGVSRLSFHEDAVGEGANDVAGVFLAVGFIEQ